MPGDLFSWYATSLAEFWGSALRVGLPQILLVILLIYWLRRKGCGKARCRVWSCGCCEDGAERSCCEAPADCGCTCGLCCCGNHDHTQEAGDGHEGE